MTQLSLTSDQKRNALIIASKLINTAVSPSFRKTLNKPWHSGHNPKIDSIQDKLGSDLERTIWRFTNWGEASACHEYLEHLANTLEVKIRKADTKGLMKALNMDEFDLISRFIYEVSAAHRSPSDHQSSQFEFHNLVSDLKSYLIAKDSIINGTGFKSLDLIISNLLKTKPVDFFKSGYLYDLLVCDRHVLFKGNNIYAIRCSKAYVSTAIIHDNSYIEHDPDNYELHLVA